MHFSLSNLVDLALGKPHYLECENFNILHTLLHVILKKTNLSETRVELLDDMADKAEKLMKLIPVEPSVCFREFDIKPDGEKIRKRVSREVLPRRSLTQVKKKWARCCPAPNNSKASVNVHSPSCISKSSISHIGDDKNTGHDVIKEVTKLAEKVDLLEKELCVFTARSDDQNERNFAAFEEFQNFKTDFQKLMPIQDNIGETDKPELLEKKTGSKQFKIEVNVREKSPQSKQNSSESESDDDDDSSQEISEISWLKERIIELSESLKLQAKCVKRLKQDDHELKKSFRNLQESLENVKCQVIEQRGVELFKHQNDDNEQNEIEFIKNEISRMKSYLKDIDVNIKKAKEETDKKLCSLRMDLMGRINQQTWSRTTTSNLSSQIIKTQNLEKSGGSTPKCCGDSERIDIKFSSSQEVFISNGCQFLGDNKSSDSIDVQPDSPETPKCQNEFYYMQPDNGESSPSVVDIQAQVSSQSFCIQHLIHDIAMKIDRSEFEFYRSKLCETVDLVLKMKRQLACSTAAGGVVPVSCISCQTSNNMKITTNTIPLVPSLKYRRTGIEVNNFNLRPQCQHFPNRYWRCQSRKGMRRVGGSHTKMRKGIEIREMRFKRLKTPIKVVSSLMLKSRFRCNQICH